MKGVAVFYSPSASLFLFSLSTSIPVQRGVEAVGGEQPWP